MAKISCVIPTYNNVELLLKTLKNLNSQTRKLDKIIIVDNDSNDETAEKLKSENLPNMEYLKLNENLGSAGGYYEGIKKAAENSDFIFLTDDDVEYHEDAVAVLEKNLKFLSENSNAAAVRCSWQGFKSKFPQKVEDAGWAGIMMRADVVGRIGLPNKALFLYAEDLEYCIRINNAGYSIYAIPEARYLSRFDKHKRNLTSWGISSKTYIHQFRLYYSFRNELYVYLRHKKTRLPKFLFHALKTIFILNSKGRRAVINGMVDGLIGKLGRNRKYTVARR